MKLKETEVGITCIEIGFWSHFDFYDFREFFNIML